MSKRVIYIVECCVTLICGSALYILFRPTTYIAGVFNDIVFIEKLRSVLSIFSCGLLKYYIPDFLWGYSLSCGLLAIYTPTLKGAIGCCFTVFIFGSAWELLQYTNILSGVGDHLDIIMYLLAAISAVTINIKGLLK